MTHGTKYLRYKIRNDRSSFSKFRESGRAKVKSFIIFIVFVSLFVSGHQCHGVCVWGGGQRATQSSFSPFTFTWVQGIKFMLSGLRREPLNLLSHTGGN